MDHYSLRNDIDNMIHQELKQTISYNMMDELSINSSTNEKIKMEDSKRLKHQQAHRPHFRIDWRQLTYYQKPSSFLGKFFNKINIWPSEDASCISERSQNQDEPKRILNSLDGCFRSGELSAILGPSGAGKSTFLSTLFGSKQEDASGRTKVTWFSDDQQSNTKRRSIRIASLPQYDNLLHHLTVYETLMFASKIKNATLSITRGRNFHRQNVKRVAKMLKLSDCLNTRCGKLSGGQYKRVSIGQELLSEPDVIILDEPTSGLDAMTCLTTVQTLKSIVTKRPISIILTIHQPDIDVFNLFDHVYVIAQGGLAIYEGPPQNIMATMAKVNLKMPSANYNPARFIVEHAFVPEFGDNELADSSTDETGNSSNSEDEGDDLDRDKNYIKRSMLSLTEAISGKEMVSNKKDKKPLLNIGIQTLDGKLITSEQLAKNKDKIQQSERWNLLQRLNQIQKAQYQSQLDPTCKVDNYTNDRQSSLDEHQVSIIEGPDSSSHQYRHNLSSGIDEKSSAKSGYFSSSGLSDRKADETSVRCHSTSRMGNKATSLAYIPTSSQLEDKFLGRSLQMLNSLPTSNNQKSTLLEETEFVVSLPEMNLASGNSTITSPYKQVRMKRQFDKRLSSKHNCSKQKDYPTLYHSFLLTHRTWLSIIRDPIFFGIQACMHTTIPIILALIFGSTQEEGCPRIGSFDLVDFAYSDSENMIQGTVSSIRQSLGNIGIIFFEMFVLSFSINCITALVFPLDMYVLLKEYRNGWYSLRSYFFGRTLADLPVPIVLHSLAMAILYFLTGQPHSLWRFGAIVILVILSSLVAQSVGLTIGALLMKSSQSAVLAAAGIVAPLFALSGFIVRIHTLPLVAQLVAKTSYLYHVLNGFIILRYGYERCQCRIEDFEQNDGHRIPNNLHTLASMWIGTYSNEYTESSAMASGISNKTNFDPNIDVVDKMMNAFKMANSYGHQIHNCEDVLPYAMLDFNLRDQDIYSCFIAMVIMLILSRFVTFSAIYYKVRSFT